MDQDTVPIGPFRLDLGRRVLLRDGKTVPLRSRPLEILCALAAAKGEVVSKDELMQRAWAGALVEENTIQVHVSALRKALDEGPSGRRYVITVPGRGYRLNAVNGPAPGPVTDENVNPALPDIPSIAVLPFQNMSADPEQGYFADGTVEEIITALSRFSGLFVIARNSSFTYQGRAVDVKQVGRELGVRYVLEGSVRRDGESVRITAQLVDAETGVHLWADYFDGELNGIFAVQERVTARVVGAIAPKIEQAEIERVKRKPTESLDAYDCYLRGRASFHRWSRESNDEALRLFCRATVIDPDFAVAYGMAALCYAQRMMNGWMIDRTLEIAETARLTDRAVEFGRNDAVALSSAALARLRVVGDIDAAASFVERALALNPNLAQAWYAGSFVKNCQGEPEVALQYLRHVMRLSPIDPLMYNMHTGTSLAHFLAGRYDEATSWAERSLLDNPNFYPALRMAAASHALAGRPEQSTKAIRRLRQLDPALRMSDVKEILPLRRPGDAERYAEGLRLAGLPD